MGGTYDSQEVNLDAKGNLFADDVSDAVIRDIFESYPPLAEDRGGYIYGVPIKYAGAAEGKIFASSSLNPLFSDYPWDFKADSRGVPRDYSVGASVGAYSFGQVSLLPGNIQDSKTIALEPNSRGPIKVKLVEKVKNEALSMTNYLGEIPIQFTLQEGDGLESFSKIAHTADNGRAFVTVDTPESGDSVVRAALKNKPSLFLDLLVRVGYANGNNAPPANDEDMYVVLLDPNRVKVSTENTHIATYSRACASSTVSIRLKGHAETIERDLPVTISGLIYGTIGKKLIFPQVGTYVFDFKMTDSRGRHYEDTKELKVADATTLKVFRLSQPPYYEDKTFSLVALFDKAPKEIDMTLTDEAGTVYKPVMHSQNNRLEWEGFITSRKTGYYTARLDYVDAADGKSYSEYFTMHVAKYYGEGAGSVSSGGGGCEAVRAGALWIFLGCSILFRIPKKR